MKTLTTDATWISTDQGRVLVPGKSEALINELTNPINGGLLTEILNTYGWNNFLRDTDYLGFKVVVEDGNIYLRYNGTSFTFSSQVINYTTLLPYNSNAYREVVKAANSVLTNYIYKHSIINVNSKLLNFENRYLTRAVNGINEDYEYPLNSLIELIIDDGYKSVVMTTLENGPQLDDDIVVLDRRIISSRNIKQANIYLLNEAIY